MPLTPSLAGGDTIGTFTMGEAHQFALALHRTIGWEMHVCLSANTFHVFPDGSELPEVVHVFAVDGDGVAWDVRGSRPAEEVLDECRAYFGVDVVAVDVCQTEADLRHYCGTWGAPGEDIVDRPLFALDERIIDEAMVAIADGLLDVPGFVSGARNSMSAARFG